MSYSPRVPVRSRRSTGLGQALNSVGPIELLWIGSLAVAGGAGYWLGRKRVFANRRRRRR